ncbi:MAG: hypothetical protein RLZZ271_334 [Pseudomonadota bacterium]|jgi:toxin CcdB
MAQYDVFKNPSKASRDDIPYVVVIQSDLLEHLSTRLVMPLSKSEASAPGGPAALCPAVDFDGQVLRALPHLMAAFRVRDLGRPVGSVPGFSSRLIGAVDAVLSGI